MAILRQLSKVKMQNPLLELEVACSPHRCVGSLCSHLPKDMQLGSLRGERSSPCFSSEFSWGSW